jgi:NAD(P)-dependent dehydrogenase (short-subunit alcohol dehydrogenase family)
LVNNAGTAWAASFGQVPEVGWDKVMDLNVKSPFFLIQALNPLTASQGKRRANRRDYQYWLDCWHVG